MLNKMELARRVRRWHDSWKSGIIMFRGRELITLYDVFPPGPDTHFFTRIVIEELCEKLKKNRFSPGFGPLFYLDMGVGTGATVLEVAPFAKVSAYGCDVNPRAVRCAEANAVLRGLSGNVLLFESDLFSNVPDITFDIISWNLPFNEVDPGGIEDAKFRGGFDPAYGYLQEFLHTAGGYLAKSGSILLLVDDLICDLDKIIRFIAEAAFNQQVIAEKSIAAEENIWAHEPCKLKVLKLTRK